MNTFKALAMADRVVLVHDTPVAATTSELAVEQAMLLLRQLEIAVHRANRFQELTSGEPICVAVPGASRH